MTDTTDIKELRERMMQQREAALTGNTPSFEDCELLVCDLLRALTLSNKQLEAERQRADNASFRENHLKDMLNDKIKQNVDLRAEIAALKGELANPVVLPPVEIGQGVCILCGKLHPTGLQCPMLRVTADKGIL